MKIQSLLLALIVILIAACTSTPDWTDEQITEYWTSGKTLPSEVLKQFPLPNQPLDEDLGYNVLVDMAHECGFTTLWGLQEQLNGLGYRAIGSHATINSTIDHQGESRIRMVYDTINKIHPFVWMPNAKYHVIISGQNNDKSQIYTDKELASLKKFVNDGGGLLLQGKPAIDQVLPALDQEYNEEVEKLSSSSG